MVKRKRINIALQGGGAHGAFTWGVLDRLLAEPRLEISGISGTSAGAINGAAVKAGLATGGADAARDNLDWLWGEIGAVRNKDLSDLLALWSPPAAWISKLLEYSPQYATAETASRMISPYAYGPLYDNPLRPIVEKLHYDLVCGDVGPALCICATDVRTGKIKVFHDADISADAILASACLPTLFQAVEIDGEAYWDGGYTGNPALFPLFVPELPSDILIVNINPLTRLDIPNRRKRFRTASTRSASIPRFCASCGRSVSSNACWSKVVCPRTP